MPAITLPARCDRTTVIALHAEFLAALGAAPLAIDGRGVTHAGQALLQLLLSARCTGKGAAIQPSVALADAAALAGVSATLFDEVAP